MGLHKGHTNNPHGRPKGVPNKVNAELREWLQMFLENNFKLLEEDFKKLQPQQRWQTFVALMKFILPTLKQEEVGFANLNTEDLRELTDNILKKLIDDERRQERAD